MALLWCYALIVGSFIMILLIPPFDENTTNVFVVGAWWRFANWASPYGWNFFQMSFNAISLFTSASIAYNLAKAYKREPLPAAFLSVMTFLLVAAFGERWCNGHQILRRYWVILSDLYCYLYCWNDSLARVLKIKIRLPKEVPHAVAESLNIVIPILAVLVTIYPFSIWVEEYSSRNIPQLIMDVMAPLIAVSDSLGAICLFVIATHLLWFLGIQWVTSVNATLDTVSIAKHGSKFGGFSSWRTATFYHH